MVFLLRRVQRVVDCPLGVKRIERPAVWGRLSILFTFFIFCLSVSGGFFRGFLS